MDAIHAPEREQVGTWALLEATLRYEDRLEDDGSAAWRDSVIPSKLSERRRSASPPPSS
jgi:hypothetical protein